MSGHLERKIIDICVAKLRNSSAITCVSRLDLKYFSSQSVSPRLVQRFPSFPAIWPPKYPVAPASNIFFILNLSETHNVRLTTQFEALRIGAFQSPVRHMADLSETLD